MTATAAPAKPATERPGIDSVPEALTGLVHMLGRFKQQIAQVTRGNTEWAYDAILFHVVSSGPLRSSALADLVQADPSTVSRQVAALVRDGMLERTADPEDGRATLLKVTDTGVGRFSRHTEQRDRHYREMLADWSEADRKRFAGYLRRFTTDFEAYRGTILADVAASYQAPSSAPSSTSATEGRR